MNDSVEEAIGLLESAKVLADRGYCDSAHYKSEQALRLLKGDDC